MATFSAVNRQHILQAIAEYDERGGENFLGVYGFGPSLEYWLVHEGRQYDSKAILGVAHKYAPAASRLRRSSAAGSPALPPCCGRTASR